MTVYEMKGNDSSNSQCCDTKVDFQQHRGVVNLKEATSDKAEEQKRLRRWIEDNEVNSGTEAMDFALCENDS